MDRYYLGARAVSAWRTDAETSGEDTAASSDTSTDNAMEDAMGERNLRRVKDEVDEQTPPGLRPDARTDVAASDDSLIPRESRDNEIQLSEPVPVPAPVLPDGLLEDVARAVEETENTRKVAKAIAQLLIEKGILTLEEVQAQMAQQKGDDSS
jgi:hypothetical protein